MPGSLHFKMRWWSLVKSPECYISIIRVMVYKPRKRTGYSLTINTISLGIITYQIFRFRPNRRGMIRAIGLLLNVSQYIWRMWDYLDILHASRINRDPSRCGCGFHSEVLSHFQVCPAKITATCPTSTIISCSGCFATLLTVYINHIL